MSCLQVRVEKELKEKAIQIAKESNIDISTAVRLFLLMVVKEKAIPFAINSENEYEKYRFNISYLLDCIDFNENSPMTLQNVEQVIAKTRKEKKIFLLDMFLVF